MIDLYLVRHGESVGNVQKILAGHTDVDLTEKGYKQADVLRDYLLEEAFDFDEIFSSPLSRAYNTIKPYALEVNGEIITRDNLKELFFGSCEGAEIEKLRNNDFHKDEYHYNNNGDAESYQQLTERVRNFLESEIFPKSGKKILVACHAGVIRGFVSALTGVTQEIPRIMVQNASVTHYEIDEETLKATCKRFCYDVYLREKGLL